MKGFVGYFYKGFWGERECIVRAVEGVFANRRSQADLVFVRTQSIMATIPPSPPSQSKQLNYIASSPWRIINASTLFFNAGLRLSIPSGLIIALCLPLRKREKKKKKKPLLRGCVFCLII